jgi:hypothetical protein
MDPDIERQRKKSRRELREAIAKALQDYHRALVAEAPSDKFHAWLENLAITSETRDSLH